MDAYLFDLDGTLIDSRVDIALCANHARQAVGLPPRPQEEIYAFIGEGALRLMERTIGAEHADLVAPALAIWREQYDQHMLDHTRVYDGIPEALAKLDGARAVVTNKPGPSARKLIEAVGLAELCPVVVGGGDVPTRKPEPEAVELALSQLPRADRVVFIGDSAIDAATARAARLPFVGVLWGLGTRAQMEAHGADRFIDSPAQLSEACAQALATWMAR